MNNRMPVLFVGHGNPMNAIEETTFSSEWIRLGRELPRPTAIVVVSAHWTTDGRFVTAMPNPKLIYDFYGFPQELSEVKYPVSGDPILAKRIAKLFPGMTHDFSWGLDHGAWSVLVRMFPDADIPVVQVSLDLTKSLEEEFELMKSFRTLRDEGVLFIGSGNVVHNLMMMRWSGGIYDWAISFDEKIRTAVEGRDRDTFLHPEMLGEIARLSMPTDEHYRPLVSMLGLIDPDETLEFFNESIDIGSISMTSFVTR